MHLNTCLVEIIHLTVGFATLASSFFRGVRRGGKGQHWKNQLIDKSGVKRGGRNFSAPFSPAQPFAAGMLYASVFSAKV